ncbi:hypothetical protein A2U01_0102199, partial [Trifolium medium]|nr:hypothetical protein [Trifolium medium]
GGGGDGFGGGCCFGCRLYSVHVPLLSWLIVIVSAMSHVLFLGV